MSYHGLLQAVHVSGGHLGVCVCVRTLLGRPGYVPRIPSSGGVCCMAATSAAAAYVAACTPRLCSRAFAVLYFCWPILGTAYVAYLPIACLTCGIVACGMLFLLRIHLAAIAPGLSAVAMGEEHTACVCLMCALCKWGGRPGYVGYIPKLCSSLVTPEGDAAATSAALWS
jgi:hypothetical protein